MAARNAALLERDALTPEESALMEDNRRAQWEPVKEPEPEPTPEPAPEPVAKTTEPVAAPEVKVPEAPVAEAPKTEETDDGKKVDLRALHEERERRKTAQKEAQELKEKLAKFEGRFGVLQELVQASNRTASADPETPIPDITVDPVGHFAAKDAIRERELATLREWRTQQEQLQQQQQRIQQISQLAGSQEAAFAAENPDYNEASNHVQRVRIAQLKAMGYDDASAQFQLRLEAAQLAEGALQRGQNPAQVIYAMATGMGWSKSAPAAPVAPAPAPAAPAPVAQQAPAAAAQKLATVAKGQAANASLATVPGSAPAETSIDQLLKMSDEDFEKATQGKNWKKLMGG